jgi:hypothetical protein
MKVLKILSLILYNRKDPKGNKDEEKTEKYPTDTTPSSATSSVLYPKQI